MTILPYHIFIYVFGLEIQCWHKELNILFCSITPTNLGQLDLKSASHEVFKTHVQFDQVLAEIIEQICPWF